MKMSFSKGYPAQYESRLTLKNGREVFLRPVLQTDGDLLVDLFNKLSIAQKAKGMEDAGAKALDPGGKEPALPQGSNP